MTVQRITVLASGGGTNLQAVMDACESGVLPARVVEVISDRPSGALRRAEGAGIPALFLPLKDRRDLVERARHDRMLSASIAVMQPDLVVLGGWMLLLGPEVLDRFAGRLINVHPALLPDGGGETVESSAGTLPALRGAHAVRDALRHGLPVTGVTVHVVTAEVDVGPVILREEVPILPGDDETTLHERIKRVEHVLLPWAAALMVSDALDSAGVLRQANEWTGGRT